MEVVAFVGPSGSGKSHRAIGVAHDNGCDAIIDDGLLIRGTKIIAGTSAKSEESRINAVRRAIFMEDSHAKVVREALHASDIQRLLIIATSDNMIGKIVKRLDLPQPVKTVYISQIATRQEIKNAKRSRLKYGKHIVPVPTVELKQHFSGYFADLTYNMFGSSQQRRGSRSIVRPAFSYYGALLISDYVIQDIVRIITDKMLAVAKVNYIHVRRRSDRRGLSVHLEVELYYGVRVYEMCRLLQAKIKQKLEYMTAMPVSNVNVSVRSLQLQRDFYQKDGKLG